MPTTTQQSGPPEWMVPYLQDYFGRAQDVANTPYQQSPGTFAGPNDTLQAGWQTTANRAMNGSGTMDAANKQLTNTINGGGFNNPYLSQQVKNAQGDLTSAWNNVQAPQFDKMMAGSGSFGNSGVSQYAGMAAGDLQKNLARISTDMRGNAYNTERSNQMAATMAAPTFAQNDYIDANALMNVGTQQQGFNQAATNQNQKWWEEANGYSQNQLNAYGGALGMNAGQNSTTTSPGASTTSQVIGGALAGSQIMPWLTGAWNSWNKP